MAAARHLLKSHRLPSTTRRRSSWTCDLTTFKQWHQQMWRMRLNKYHLYIIPNKSIDLKISKGLSSDFSAHISGHQHRGRGWLTWGSHLSGFRFPTLCLWVLFSTQQTGSRRWPSRSSVRGAATHHYFSCVYNTLLTMAEANQCKRCGST